MLEKRIGRIKGQLSVKRVKGLSSEKGGYFVFQNDKKCDREWRFQDFQPLLARLCGFIGNFQTSPKSKTQRALRIELAVDAVEEGGGW